VKPGELHQFVAALPFIDTHSHMAGGDAGSPLDDRAGKSLPQVLMSDHLRYLLEAQWQANALFDNYRQWKPEDAEAHMAVVLPLLDRVRNLTAYSIVREGIRELHPFPEPDITEANWRRINDQILAAYRQHGEREWQRQTARRAGVVLMNQMVTLPYVTDHWDSLPRPEREAQRRWLLPSLVLDGYLFSGFKADWDARQRSEALVGLSPRTHAQYLEFLDRVLELFVGKGGRSVKLMTAYVRSLRFDPIPDLEAARLFARGPHNLRGEGLTRLQNNLFWHLIERVQKRDLPLIVHAGYSTHPDWASPRHLIPLLQRFPGMNVDVSHSGWPNHGTALILARQFGNCYFNLCWTPVLSRALGRRMLSEAIDMLPVNMILIGTDTGTPEAFLGAVRLTRALVAEVLEEKVCEGQFDIDVAKRVAKAILFDNALEFYGMNADDLSAHL
jgi:hypothetical protein